MLLTTDETDIPGGVVHDVPGDLRDALRLDPKARATWRAITPLARNEWICWIQFAKKSETRRKRIKWSCSSLSDGSAVPVVGRDAPIAGTHRFHKTSVHSSLIVAFEREPSLRPFMT